MERNHWNVTFVTSFSHNGSLKIPMLPVHDGNKTFECEFVITALLIRAVWLNVLLQFTMLRNHSNVTFVIPFFTKRNTLLRFMKVRNLSHVIYVSNQSYSQKESLWRHISAVNWKDIFFQFMNVKKQYNTEVNNWCHVYSKHHNT